MTRIEFILHMEYLKLRLKITGPTTLEHFKEAGKCPMNRGPLATSEYLRHNQV